MHEFGMPEICLAREEQNIVHPCTAKQDWKIIFDRLKRTVKLHENEFQKQKLDDFSENSNFHTKLCKELQKQKVIFMSLKTTLKFIYSEKVTKFFEISTLLLSYVVPVKSKVEISQNLVAFSEYMNFNEYSGYQSFSEN